MRQLLKNLLLLSVTTIIMLLIAEGVVRLVYPAAPPTMDTFNVNRGNYYRADDTLGWLPRPNLQGVHNRTGSFESTFTTNAQGLRDREHDFAKPPGVSRIVAVGDSFAWGFGVNDGEIFTDVLERRTDNWEVINLGVTAFSLKQETIYFEILGTRYEPDLWLIAFTHNDIMEGATASVFTANREAQQASEDSDESRSFAAASKDFLSTKSALYKAITQTINSSPALVRLAVKTGLKEPLGGFDHLDNNLAPALIDEPPQLAAAWQQFASDLQTTRSVADEAGVRLVIAAIPAVQSVDSAALQKSLRYSNYSPDDFDIDKPYRRLAGLCADLGIEFINPVSRFRAEAATGKQLYLTNDMHFNASGHELFAEVIMENLASAAPSD